MVIKWLKIFSIFIALAIMVVSCKQEKETTVVSEKKDMLQQLNELIQSETLNPKLRFERAKLLGAQNRYDEAIEDMRVAILNDSTNMVYYHLLSDLFMDSNNSSKSLLTMKKSAQLFPDSILTLLKLSETYFILKQYNESIFELNEIIRRQANNAEAYLMLGMNFRAMGDVPRAVNSFQTATEKNPKLVDAWIILGDLFSEKKEDIARRYYETAVNVAPEDINALHSKAFYLQNNNDIEGALEIYKKINIINPKYSDAYLNAGILLLEKDSLNRALEQFDIMTKMDPTNAKSYYFKALTFERMGNTEGSIKDAQNALNFDPNYKEADELLKKLK